MKLNQIKINFKDIKFLIPYGIIAVIAFIFNFWTGTRGVFPIDTFLHYDSAYKILTGEKPIRDFWIIHGITLDYIQGLFFLLFGVNWISYLIHSSLFNSVIVLIFFKLLRSLNLHLYYSLTICLCFATLTYPISGVPFIDHHSSFLSLISLLIFYFAISNKNYQSIIFIPILFGLAFLSKPVPASYIAIMFIAIFFIYFFSEKKFKPFLYLFLGGISFFIFLVIFLNTQDISLKSFINQLILYPLSIGGQRTGFISEAINNRFFNYKFVYLLIVYIIFMNIVKKNFLKFTKEKIVLFFLVIFFSFFMIIHQILTKNQNFIFFLIPLNIGLIIYLNNKINFKGNKIINFLFLIICIILTFKYNERFNYERKFHDLQSVKLENAVEASSIDDSLYPLKWITTNYKDPYEEIKIIKKLIEDIDKSEKNVLLISNYNFIDSVTKKKIFSVVKNFDPVSIPSEENKFYENFKIHFIELVTRKKIQEILIFVPSINDSKSGIDIKKIVSEFLIKDCFNYEEPQLSLIKIKLKC